MREARRDALAALLAGLVATLFGVLFAVILLGEPIGLLQVFGGLVVVAGVTLSVRADAEKESVREASAGEAAPSPPGGRKRGTSVRGGKTWVTQERRRSM